MTADEITARIRSPLKRKTMSTTASKLIISAADGFDALDRVVADTAVSAALSGASALLRGVAGLLEDRTPEEAIAVLELLKVNGTQPVSQGELDDQVKKTLDRAAAKP